MFTALNRNLPGRRAPNNQDMHAHPSWPRSQGSALALAGFLLAAGSAHFVVPESYRKIVPQLLGDPAFWVRWSGVAEIACAVLVAHPRTRRVGGWTAAVLFLAVFPANVRMALDGGVPGASFPLGSPVVAWARLPLQIPLVVWAWRVARSSGSRLDRTPALPQRS
ncbi:MAG: DoxX family protein [Acidimicrobiales bacterium]